MIRKQNEQSSYDGDLNSERSILGLLNNPRLTNYLQNDLLPVMGLQDYNLDLHK